jgi:hypothetical protein
MGWASARIRANGGATRVKKNVRLVEPETFPESKHFPELPTAESYNGIGRAIIKRNSRSPFMGMKVVVLV